LFFFSESEIQFEAGVVIQLLGVFDQVFSEAYRKFGAFIKITGLKILKPYASAAI